MDVSKTITRAPNGATEGQRSFSGAAIGGRGDQPPQPTPEQIASAATSNGDAFSEALGALILRLVERDVAHAVVDIHDWLKDEPFLTHEINAALGYLFRTGQLEYRPWVAWPKVPQGDLIHELMIGRPGDVGDYDEDEDEDEEASR